MDEPKIHIGSGPIRLDGWVNTDIRRFEAVDVISDIRCGFPFSTARFIFAEHFIEHLSLDEALEFLEDCRSVLVSNGVLRISTPNLDWVWATSYPSRWRPTSPATAEIRPADWQHDSASSVDCLGLNLAFRGWGHKFLFNQSMLEYALLAAGFGSLKWCRYGESDYPDLSGLERHPQDPDIAGISDVLIVEGSGKCDPRPVDEIDREITEYRRETADGEETREVNENQRG